MFGSAARGQIGPESDVDLLVGSPSGARTGLLELAAMMRELPQTVGRPADLARSNRRRNLCSAQRSWLRSDFCIRPDHERFLDMLEALDSLRRFIGARSEEDYLGDELMRYAVARRLTAVGEAASLHSGDLAGRHPALAWAGVAAFRKILVHGHFGVHWPLVWITTTRQAPHLRGQVAGIPRTGFPD